MPISANNMCKLINWSGPNTYPSPHTPARTQALTFTHAYTVARHFYEALMTSIRLAI